jgi:short-subunit dehydrogenase
MNPPRTALVTGASSGIGAALAERMARDGVHVVLAARRAEALDEVAERIAGAGGRATALPLDVTRPEETVAAIERIDDELAGLDLVVANAGVGVNRWSGKLGYAACAETLAVNVVGATATLTAVLPRMVERGRGHLVGISSLASQLGLPKSAVYCGSKAFLSMFLEALRVDLRHTGVHVTDVRPGYVKTAMTADNARMPFALEAAPAAEIIWKSILARRAVVAFPWPTAAVVRLAAMLPRPIYDRVVGSRPRTRTE